MIWAGFFNFIYFWPLCEACGILVSLPGIEPRPTAVKAPSPNHWTARDFPELGFKAELQTSNLWTRFSPHTTCLYFIVMTHSGLGFFPKTWEVLHKNPTLWGFMKNCHPRLVFPLAMRAGAEKQLPTWPLHKPSVQHPQSSHYLPDSLGSGFATQRFQKWERQPRSKTEVKMCRYVMGKEN